MYNLKVCHLYGNLLNTYGDNGNLLMLNHRAKQKGIQLDIEVISLKEAFDPAKYDIVFFGGGQDYEQLIVSKDIQDKKEALTQYIENDGVTVAICGGYQLLGHYYMDASGNKIDGIGALDHYTLSQDNSRFIGDIVIKNEEFGETYVGFENHNGMTFLGKDEKPLGIVQKGKGNNGKDQTEGAIYKQTYCSYFHGPLLVKNTVLTDRVLKAAMKNRYPEIELAD
ncbi:MULTISPECIES: type 1 glutamine amidotransferase [Carnobacterium]|uniref:Lipid II isoglutaminyl synthase (glutamine-hydrolyzing) subunit GatD n=1 Tax=Carnobacterium divergens TaxID=2748 RepID=A0A2R7ZYH1_CARDV|nr:MULTISPECIES: adenosylcobyric acid synthase [Carnobacterium]MCO6018398.1 adenosylcobyric acid synthase [Carnobacterium divergens]MDT1939931.1 glutamine amidotransferase [Carnobacterium divergens]MDT1942369.1 glutamine amidotransferase [Carnobacterium divergens]MDT1948175.1 glutamine amidotransferase [Carnobacterium divergens]MDT1950655.1 glutamine amidotransferase [Carnobacterium divergens]